MTRPIRSEAELEQAVQEYQRLKDAPEGSAQAARRDELDAEIKAYYVQHAQDLRKGKPPS